MFIANKLHTVWLLFITQNLTENVSKNLYTTELPCLHISLSWNRNILTTLHHTKLLTYNIMHTRHYLYCTRHRQKKIVISIVNYSCFEILTISTVNIFLYSWFSTFLFMFCLSIYHLFSSWLFEHHPLMLSSLSSILQIICF